MSSDKPSHSYHLVEPSPWPVVCAAFAFVMALGGIAVMNGLRGNALMPIEMAWLIFGAGALGIAYVMFGWFGDIIKEAQSGENHSFVVMMHFRYGMILFIFSEVMFFVAWFWAYFDVALLPDSPLQPLRTEATGGVWPPKGVEVFDPLGIPLLNTLILLLSGTTVTWAHHALLNNDRQGLIKGLTVTVILGVIFSGLQAYEYVHASYGFSDSIFTSAFYMATGFHGFHVIVGTIFLFICLVRARSGHFTPSHHIGFEAAAWYWHFVDVVWLFLYVFVYLWPGFAVQ